MGHVVDEVGFHLRESLLAEDDVDGGDERDEQDEREDDRGHQEGDRPRDVVALRREIDLEVVPLRGRIVGVEHLRDHVGRPGRLLERFVLIDRHAVLVHHGENVGQIQTAVDELSAEVAVERTEVHAFVDGLEVGRVDQIIEHLVDQSGLILVALQQVLLLLLGSADDGVLMRRVGGDGFGRDLDMLETAVGAALDVDFAVGDVLGDGLSVGRVLIHEAAAIGVDVLLHVFAGLVFLQRR